MADEDIRKLARSAAEEMYKGYKEKNIALMEDEFKMVISFILKEYCIVEKEKAVELHKESSQNYQIANNIDKQAAYYAKGKIDALTTLFGKELFNDTEK